MDGYNRRWLLSARPQGPLKSSDFTAVREPIPEPADGEFLVRVTHLSFDPTQRGWISTDTYVPAVPIGGVVRAAATGIVVKSRNASFSVGQRVQGAFGWQDYTISNGHDDLGAVAVLPDGVSDERALGVFGLTGMTAYFGLTEIGMPKAGDTVLVSGAAGATGSVVVQLAKAIGCRVIGVAGGAEKCAWVRDIGGADGCIDYKCENIWRRLQVLAPGGVDVVFDNVGGDFLEAAIVSLAHRGRIVMCGSISSYEQDPREQRGTRFLLMLPMKRARMEGFIVLDYAPRYSEAIAELSRLLGEGKLHSVEDMQYGFDSIPATLNRLFSGQNLGKQLLRMD